jgi:hypothetical protein
MKTFNAGRKAAYCAALVALSVTMLASVTTHSRANSATINITVVNNTSGDIRHLFLSAPDSNNWTSDQLNDSAITPSHSFTAHDVSCSEANIRVIAEDQDGCFIYRVVSCSSDPSWTITDDATRDCGSD